MSSAEIRILLITNMLIHVGSALHNIDIKYNIMVSDDKTVMCIRGTKDGVTNVFLHLYATHVKGCIVRSMFCDLLVHVAVFPYACTRGRWAFISYR